MYTSEVPRFTIDLEEHERDRWREVIQADRAVVAKLVEEAEEDYEYLSDFARTGLSVTMSLGYRFSRGRHKGEMKTWAKALGRSFSDVVIANCSYELSHLLEGINPFGCTAGVRKVPKLGMVHVRSMDWPLERIGEATRIFEFKEGKRKFYSVGVSGFVGVLSGMLPGAYSATINWAPADGRPKFDFGPAFLLREVFETCDTYEEAVEMLRYTRIATPVFFTVCGTKTACVIERTHRDGAIRPLQGSIITQANHHVDNLFELNNTDKDLYEWSKERADNLNESLWEAETDSLESLASSLDVDEVCNEDSYQQMIFHPASGQMRVWRWV
jgi:hypothetical protein